MSEILAKNPLPVNLAKDPNSKNNEKVIIKDINYFNKSSTMKKLKKDLIVNKKIKKFQDKVSDILNVIETFQCENKVEMVFVFVIQSAEDYFDPVHESVKKEVCKKMLLKYVNDDEDLCRSFIRLTDKNIKKSTFTRRLKKKLENLSVCCFERNNRLFK